MNIALVFSAKHPETPTWPYKGFDYVARAKYIEELFKREFPNIKFITKIAYTPKDVEELIKRKDIIGYIVVIIGIWNKVPYTVASCGKPVILIDDLYGGSGEFLDALSRAQSEGYPVVGFTSIRIRNIIQSVRLLETLLKLKEARIVLITDEASEWHKRVIKVMDNEFGIKTFIIPPNELVDEYNKVSNEEAIKWKEYWIRNAESLVEPSEEEVMKSAKMYIAMRKIIEKYRANAITISCLGLFYKNMLPAYPCLGFMQLLNDGIVATCEADLDSLFTQLVIQFLTGRPGYVSDPVIDEDEGVIVYAHCLASTRPYGKGGIMVPYKIRSHSEDRKGASIQAYWPPGEKVTTIKFNLLERAMAIHSGVISHNVEEERACRTKIAVKTNVDAILKNWNREAKFGWHRVTVLGDYRKLFIKFAKLIKFKVIEEDRE